MANVALDVVGFITGLVLGIIQIALPLLDVPDNAPHSIVRIGVGLSDNTDELGGSVPGLTVWNEIGDKIGHIGSPSGKILEGTFQDIIVDQSSNQQPTYLRVEGGGDSICIAYIGHSWPDGTKRGWLGDLGRFCNKQWYYSSLYVTESNGTEYMPMCTWIGGTGSGASEIQQMTIHTSAFSAMGDGTTIDLPPDPSSLCTGPSTYWNNDMGGKSRRAKRSSLFSGLMLSSILGGATTAPPFQNTIIGSHHAGHNSTELCSNPWSYGPDFVSFYEGVYCHMSSRSVWPLCNTEEQEDCYDWDTRTLVNRKLRKREMGYNKVIEWQ